MAAALALALLSACAAHLPFLHPAEPGTSGAPGGEASAPSAPAAPATPAPNLIGKSGPDLIALLGRPGLIRKDKGVEVWQYSSASCVLLFYLYDPPAGGARHVTYVEAMPQGLSSASASGQSLSAETCLARQLQALGGRS